MNKKFLIVLPILFLCIVGLTMFLVANQSTKKSSHVSPQLPPSAESIGVPEMIHANIPDSGPPRRWCDGDEIICLNTITSTPTETMGKLVAAFPTDKGKRYKIRLSVEKIEDTASETDIEKPALQANPTIEPPPKN